MERFWIVDDEWPDYDAEVDFLKDTHKGCGIMTSKSLNDEDIEMFGAEADALICQINVRVDRELLSRLKNCKVVSVYGAGYNNVDAAAARELGISVTNVPGYCAEEVADYVIAAIYHRNLNLGRYAENVSNGLWGARAISHKPRRISRLTLFIAGFGSIGRKLAEKASGLGMNVMYYDSARTPAMDETAKKIGAKSVSLEEGLSSADVVSSHLALTDETRGFFSCKMFAMMKREALFVNVSRGGIVDEPALIDAVKRGVIASAALDVTANEPPGADDPILHTENICVTPHISYLSEDSMRELKFRAAKNASDVTMGRDIPEIVNKR
ncbi:MAG: C-terminal binding protein [Synergistaceae bacterium]|jgi:phosphoglycerate dehydrogenase-like enzyme|nr:C-terminal binding protein [Synergistaceae bacterium]